MIIDKIENAKLYSSLNERIIKALNYIISTDLKNITEGRHDIDSDIIYALINIYDTKDREDCHLEAHRKYIDVQFVVSGSELFGYAPLLNQKPHSEYNSEKDFELFDEEPSFIKFETGMFAIFFPEDLHMPGIKINSHARVKKVVIKVMI
jgi:YhcH/YjgK/YiaL family protein